MRLLIDTHILMWSLVQTINLSRRARAVIGDDDNDRLFSAASIWEIAIKTSLGKAGFMVDPRHIMELALRAGFRELPVTSAAAFQVADLPLHHRDPFDRLLIAQATEEDALLLTSDATLAAYGQHVLMVG